MPTDTLAILDGSTFLVSDLRGDIDATPERPHGLYHRDTRFLSRWLLTLNGRPLDVLSTDETQYFSAQFFLTPPRSVAPDAPYLSVVRRRAVGDGFHEDVTVVNHNREPVEVELRLEVGADFADLFEVKEQLDKKGETYRRVDDEGRLVLGYRRDEYVRETIVHAKAPEAVVSDGGYRFLLRLEPHERWSTCINVVPVAEQVCRVKYGHGKTRPQPNMSRSLEEWLEQAPRLETDWDELYHAYERSLVDLAALRFYPQVLPEHALPAAGLPWFMTVFGRDSLIASYQALPFHSELAETTLRALAIRQGKAHDDFRDEQPGKILHEIRFGELTAFGERPHSPYFGAADSTPLFLVLLDETVRWTGDDELARGLEPAARAALAWIDSFPGWITYERRRETGLENQCWKDSWDSIVFSDGTIAPSPRAVCEIQGYAYDARVRTARLAREVWGDDELAERLELEAADWKRRFNEEFWLDDREFFALALDAQGRRVDSLTSNVGHLLWSGIVDDDKVAPLVRHLMSDALFSGWGVRTMAEGEGAYNPIRYHNGTVWPHDNSLIALGLARHGYRDEANRIAVAMLEAAVHFRYRLPEVFAGYPREETMFPVEYPSACSPQAWATGAPLVFLRTMLGLEPGGAQDPHLPEPVTRLELHTTVKETT